MAERTLGLALGGGGGKGSAHVGVLREFERLGVEIDAISGTSIGAIVGAAAAAGMRAGEIERLFRSTTVLKILDIDPAFWGLIGSQRLAEVLHSIFGDMRIEDLPIPYAAVAVDLVTGQEVVLERGAVIEAVLASAAVPGVFPPRRVKGMILADGGIRNNLPVDVARRLGAERVIAVNLIDQYREFSLPKSSRYSPWSPRRWVPVNHLMLAERAIGIMIEQLTAMRLQQSPPDLLLAPDVNAISMADLHHFEDGIAAGEAAVAPYVDELDVLRRWRLGEELSLHHC